MRFLLGFALLLLPSATLGFVPPVAPKGLIKVRRDWQQRLVLAGPGHPKDPTGR